MLRSDARPRKTPEFGIAGRPIGPGHPTYVIAEVSANHHQERKIAEEIVAAAAAAGADAVKLQTYTADTITLDCRNEHFQIRQGTIWDGKVLHDLYQEAYTPWEWQPGLAELAASLGLHCFSSPFDRTAVAFLEEMDVPAYKVASFELVDLPLIRCIAGTGKPMVISTGMASLAEIDEAVRTARAAGATSLALLRTNSGYPASPAEIHLRCIPRLAEVFGCVAGLSDHTLGIAVPVAAVALGACIIEKHITLSRATAGPDSAFSLEPREFEEMVEAIRVAEQALGRVHFGATEKERASRQFRRSLFIVQDVRQGELLTAENVRSIRPGSGLHTRYLETVLGRRAARDAPRGTPLSWDLVS
jgi:N-acetylneuraminate synthase